MGRVVRMVRMSGRRCILGVWLVWTRRIEGALEERVVVVMEGCDYYITTT